MPRVIETTRMVEVSVNFPICRDTIALVPRAGLLRPITGATVSCLETEQTHISVSVSIEHNVLYMILTQHLSAHARTTELTNFSFSIRSNGAALYLIQRVISSDLVCLARFSSTLR
jgi:hypothetical protein